MSPKNWQLHRKFENLTGLLHVPMQQNPVSGRYTVPNGATKVQGQYNDVGSPTQEFVAELKRDNDGPITQFRLGINLK